MSAPFVKIFSGDVLDHLRQLPDESVHCCVTSPPYWGLRDYSRCGCAIKREIVSDYHTRQPTSTDMGGGILVNVNKNPDPTCPICHGTGKIAGTERQLGLEPTPELYVQKMTEVFHEVKRVLRKDGVLFVNMGDCYGGNATSDGTSRKAPEDSLAHDCPSPRPSGEYEATASEADHKSRTDNQLVRVQDGDSRAPIQANMESERDHSATLDSSRPKLTPRSSSAMQGQQPSPSLESEPLPSVQESTTHQSSQQLPGECLHSASCAFYLSASRSSTPDAQGCVHKSVCIEGKVPRLSASVLRTEGMAHSGGPCSTIVSKDYNGVAVRWPKVKPKDLVGQPWRLAFALQADGWYLRSDIIWSKPNPMPESVTDRPTKAHEYIFLLSKSPRYFYDQEAVREKNADVSIKRAEYGWDCDRPSTKNANFGNPGIHVEKMGDRFVNPAGRNSRTVWDIATQPYPEAHFATFPEELPRRCIKAGTSEKGCCPKCGAPWERVVEGRTQLGAGYHNHEDDLGMGQHHLKGRKIIGQDYYNGVYSSGKMVGWQPTCSCNEPETVPCVVLDPFAGSGTTGAVARSMGRSSVLIELNPEYIKLIKERTNANVTALDGFSEEVNG